MTPSTWQVYIVECADRTLYTGIARDLEQRIANHNTGRGARYTRGRRPVTLVYAEAVPDRATPLISPLNRCDGLAKIRRSSLYTACQVDCCLRRPAARIDAAALRACCLSTDASRAQIGG